MLSFEAKFYSRGNGKAVCMACERKCVVPEGKTGFCGVRENRKGKLYALAYGRPAALSLDPIEKKPIYMFRPGSTCLSMSTFGCNFACVFCQNSGISKEFSREGIGKLPFTPPEKVVEIAVEQEAEGIAYTYTEPTVFVEYALDTMRLARKKGLYNAWVSNGYMSVETRNAVLPFLDAINIDCKGSQRVYSELCGGASLEKVEENARFFTEKGVHTELTNLVIPGWNDSNSDFERITDFALSLGKETPLHFSRFFPCYKLSFLPPTPKEKLFEAKRTAESKGLENVFLGNV